MYIYIYIERERYMYIWITIVCVYIYIYTHIYIYIYIYILFVSACGGFRDGALSPSVAFGAGLGEHLPSPPLSYDIIVCTK